MPIVWWIKRMSLGQYPTMRGRLGGSFRSPACSRPRFLKNQIVQSHFVHSRYFVAIIKLVTRRSSQQRSQNAYSRALISTPLDSSLTGPYSQSLPSTPSQEAQYSNLLSCPFPKFRLLLLRTDGEPRRGREKAHDVLPLPLALTRFINSPDEKVPTICTAKPPNRHIVAASSEHIPYTNPNSDCVLYFVTRGCQNEPPSPPVRLIRT
ncbi:hypothetical protein BDP55DRAFT_630117 [Colletotrichum godetiae]|uniref:Uncharacterized protein n=1 Tax=Colletotrichum godetiae TaxID=1209918 RepID=A0AAJ0ATR6_9PEZI|nr:uncharacterized protein BDP55DRAFT_630117 [Colletotrichum godetiae]KAK1687994.1 hypothetical protein BDP55DRAFT_630117 [Colletotrichum godetiae]